MDALVVDRERQIDNDERSFGGASDHFRVIDHLVQRNRQRVVVSLHHHCQRVADQQHIDARLIQQACHREIVGRQHRDLLAALLHLGKRRNGQPLTEGGRRIRFGFLRHRF